MAEVDPLIDAEAGQNEADEGDYEVDEVIDDEPDEDEDEAYDPASAAEGAPKKEKLPPLGAWKEALTKVTQENIPEEKLHEVDWSEVLMQFGMNIGAVAGFALYTVVSGLPMWASIPFFLITFVESVVLVEFVLSLTEVRDKAICAAIPVVIFGLGFVFGHPISWLHIFFRAAFIPLFVVICVLRFLETPQQRTLHNNSPCFQAIMGRRFIYLYEQLDLVKFAKALCHLKDTSKWRSFSTDISSLGVGMVTLDDRRQDLPDCTLQIDTQEQVEPGEFQVTQLIRISEADDGSGVFSKEYEEMKLVFLQRVIRGLGKVSDRLVNGWVDDKAFSKEKPGPAVVAGKEDPKAEVRKWFNLTDFKPTGNHTISVQLRRDDYIAGLFAHWAFRACWGVLVAAILSMPAVHLFMQFDETRTNICGDSAPSTLTLDGTDLCGTDAAKMSCAGLCGSFIEFAAAMNDRLDISYVELSMSFVLLPVYLFVFSVGAAQVTHQKNEMIFLRRLQEAKKAVREVTTIKKILEAIFNISTLWHRLINAIEAFFGSDPTLSATGPITEAEFDLTAAKGVNDCFKQVMKPIVDKQSSVSCERSAPLGLGIAYNPGDTDGKETIINEWTMLKYRNSLGDKSKKNYKIMFDVKFYREDSWKFFREWLNGQKQNGYKEQLDYLLNPANKGSQDKGTKVHLKDNTKICEVMLPKCFSLTHIYVQAMPEDGSPFQIEVGAGDFRNLKEAEADFKSQLDNLEKSLLTKTDDDAIEDQITQEFIDNEWTSKGPLDRRLSFFPIVARFALSEQYWNNFNSQEWEQLFPAGKPKPEGVDGGFTAFVDWCLTPQEWDNCYELQAAGEDWYTFTDISVFMGDDDPTAALITAFQTFVAAFFVYIQVIVLVLVIPIMRVVMQHGKMFPAPYTLMMVLNAVSAFIQFAAFFAEFHTVKTRLSLIGECLGLLETKTLAPSDAAAKAAAPGTPAAPANGKELTKEEKAAAALKAAAEAKAAKKAAEDTKPFDLFVMEDTSQVKKYDPNDPFWVAEFRKKHDNVRNWHLTVGYLRVFVSTSRLTAQAILVAAAIIVGFLMLLSVVQAMQGKGAVSGIDSASLSAEFSGTIAMAKEKANAALEQAQAMGQEHLDAVKAAAADAVNSATTRRLMEVVAAGATAFSSSDDFQEPLSKATRRLREALEPSRKAMHAVLWRQHNILANTHRQLHGENEVLSVLNTAARRLNAGDDTLKQIQDQTNAAMDKAKNIMKNIDVTKATKTQLFTVFMVILVMAYSIPLIWSIVLVNGYFDKHEDLLIKQKESHRINQARREGKAADSAAAPADASAAAPAAAADPAPATAATDGTAVPGGQVEMSRYERMVEMAVESTKKTRERFPLKLFGFIISAQLLATWVGLAASPMISQVKQMAPGLSMAACNYVARSPWIDMLQNQVNTAENAVKSGIEAAEKTAEEVAEATASEKAKASATASATATLDEAKASLEGAMLPKISLRRIIQDNICTPLASMVSAKAEAVQDPFAPTSRLRRRLLEHSLIGTAPINMEVPEFVPVIQTWWKEHPHHHPEAKFAAVQTILEDHTAEAERLLVSAPAAAARAFARKGEAGLWEALGVVAPHLEAIVAKELHHSGHIEL